MGGFEEENLLQHSIMDDNEENKFQHVTEISTYQDDDVVENYSQPLKIASTSIRSRMIEENKN